MKQITEITPGSIAEEIGIQPGSFLLEINGVPVADVFDYKLLTNDEYVELLIESNSEQTLYEVEKDSDEDLGLTFETWLMDKPRSCHNKCVFCFIDQMPRMQAGEMRNTLYFKDDDPRLSFISGNYVTLTNISNNELARLISHRLSPINISVHAMNDVVRKVMLNNKNAGKLELQLNRLHAAEIEMNFQIVLCKGVNDGTILDDTIIALAKYMPWAKSLSVVPAGITKHRQGLYPLEPFTAEEAVAVLAQIEKHQQLFQSKHGTRFVYPSDEFFLTAGQLLPSVEYYDDFPQLENGVGMMTLFREEFRAFAGDDGSRTQTETKNATAVTGTLAYPLIKELLANYNITVRAIKNTFFGETITVSGLITGGDLIQQLSGMDLGAELFIPKNMLKADEPIFLDNITLAQAEQQLGVKITVVGGGADFAQKISTYRKED